MMNAYTVKKVLPRVLIAAIAINLSYYLVIIAIDISNIIGDGISGLLTAPFQGLTWDPGALSQMILSLVAIIAAFKLFKRVFSRTGRTQDQTAGLGYFMLSIVLPAALVILAIFAVLAIRLGLMIALAVAAPLAFAAFILPNTEGLFKKWWSLFMTTLLIYPIVMTLIALGRVMTYIFGNVNGNSITEGITGVFAVLSQFIALALIPFAFKFAGGIISGVANFATGKAAGGIKSLIQGDAKDPNSRINRSREKRDTADLNRRLAGNERAGKFTGNRKSKLGKWAGKSLQRSVAGYDVLGEQAAWNKKFKEEMSDTISTGDDSQIRALTARKIKQQDGSYKWMSAAGKEMKESDVIAARQRWGNNHSAYQHALTYEMSKTNTAEEAAMVAQAFDGSDGNGALVEDWNLSDREAKGMWTGSAYANQNNRLEWKYMSWNDGANNGAGGMVFDSAGFATEVYEKRGSYQLSQMGATTINALRQEHKSAQEAQARATTPMEQQQAAERLHRIESIADTLSIQARQANMIDGEGNVIPAGENGEPTPMGHGPGAVNDEIAAFIKEVNPGRAEDRIVMDQARSMTGPTETPRAPAQGPGGGRPTVDQGRAANTRENQGTPHTNDPKNMG